MTDDEIADILTRHEYRADLPDVKADDVKEAMLTALLSSPVVGDVLGLGMDAHMYATEPKSRNKLNYFLTALGLGIPGAMGAAALTKGSRGSRMPTNQEGAIKAFHGSPHDFDKFSMERIGTGEGAQAYGHGLYFAESEDVARGYRDALADSSSDARYTIGGEEFGRGTPEWKAAGEVQRGGIEDAKQLGRMYENDLLDGQKYLEEMGGADFVDRYQMALQRIQDGAEVGENRGRMYQVEIDANPEDFLDWDRPLSEQSEQVRKALKDSGVTSYIEEMESNYFDSLPESARRLAKQMAYGGDDLRIGDSADRNWDALYKAAPDVDHNQIHDIAEYHSSKSGADIYSDISRYSDANSADATTRLASQGIKGIKYKDGFSRGAEGGTSNYVVFDENIINIIQKYGITGAAAAIFPELFGEDYVTN